MHGRERESSRAISAQDLPSPIRSSTSRCRGVRIRSGFGPSGASLSRRRSPPAGDEELVRPEFDTVTVRLPSSGPLPVARSSVFGGGHVSVQGRRRRLRGKRHSTVIRRPAAEAGAGLSKRERPTPFWRTTRTEGSVLLRHSRLTPAPRSWSRATRTPSGPRRPPHRPASRRPASPARGGSPGPRSRWSACCRG